MNRVVAVIPARIGSTRLPGKPLLRIGGAPMIEHVVRAATAAQLVQSVVVATDDDEIAQAATKAGAVAVMTASELPTGTDRVAAAARQLNIDADVIVNVQGDEPLVDPAAIDLSAQMLLSHDAADIATISAPLPPDALLDPSKVKVVCGAHLEPSMANATMQPSTSRSALFFSRAPIGVDRTLLGQLLDPPEGADSMAVGGASPPTSWAARLHVGLYAYRPASLQAFVALPPSRLESLESLEQMRALEAGMTIAVGEVEHAAWGVDTLDDLHQVEREWMRRRAI